MKNLEVNIGSDQNNAVQIAAFRFSLAKIALSGSLPVCIKGLSGSRLIIDFD